uniref:Uncharacterized protein n=1 Tax=Meloidogyne enterolobii TaxID=390850 RepID=A0A6V7TNL3_MELEN|nr:unnamed protein product [Meloidogyne enterolobii]
MCQKILILIMFLLGIRSFSSINYNILVKSLNVSNLSYSNFSEISINKRIKRQFFGNTFGGIGGGCCPFGGMGPINMPMCCSPIILAPCCMPVAPLLPLLPPPMPMLPPPMPILPPPFLPMSSCCACCMPACLPVCLQSTCGGSPIGSGLFNGMGGCPFGGWRKMMIHKAKTSKVL